MRQHSTNRMCLDAMLRSFAFILICFASGFQLFANHMSGGEITYRWLGAKKYEVKLVIYRDCRGIPFNAYSLMVRSDSLTWDSVVMQRQSITDVTNRCKDSSAFCKPNVTYGNIGVEKHVFLATVDFSQAPYSRHLTNNSCLIYFSFQQCCRNTGIQVSSTYGGNVYLESMLNICNSNFKNSSPEFNDQQLFFAACNSPYYQNMSAHDYKDYDSVVYEASLPMSGHGYYETYDGSFNSSIPLTPLCSPPGVVNCKAQPTINPPRGFYIDQTNGNYIFTPTNCSEFGVIASRISEYRKVNGTMVLVGYVRREIMVVIAKLNDKNVQSEVSVNSSYDFKVGEAKCIDFKTSDSLFTGANKGDSTFLSILDLPPGANFTYTDPTAKNKTGRFCWTPHDSIYLKQKNTKNIGPVVLQLKDNYCPWPTNIQKGFNIRLLPPDSTGKLKVTVYEDINNNGVRDSNDVDVTATIRIKDDLSTFYLETDDAGQFTNDLSIGKYQIGIAGDAYYKVIDKDSNFKIKFNNTHQLYFRVERRKGVYGRIYTDLNSNCKFDNGEPVFSGVHLATNGGTYNAYSDKKGVFYLDPPNGNYQLTIPNQHHRYFIDCPDSNLISLSITKDSLYKNNDFAIRLNPDYTDVVTNVAIHSLRRGGNDSATIICSNEGYKKMLNIKVMLPIPQKLKLYSSGNYLGKYGDTITLKIDTLYPGTNKKLRFDFLVHQDSFKANNLICFKAFTDNITTSKDSLPDNNVSNTCGYVTTPRDPNNKIIQQDSNLTVQDKKIAYTIHFENSGTDYAERVVVLDTLDMRFLDPAQFKLNWSDYPCDVQITGNIIRYTFDNIKLPYKSLSPSKCNAAFNFTLGVNTTTGKETAFRNRAAIYFDYEDPIFTPAAIAKIVSPIKIRTITSASLCNNNDAYMTYYSKINFKSDNQFIIEVSDSLGNFDNATTLSVNASSASEGKLHFVPSTGKTGTYLLRVKSTSPALVSISDSGYRAINFKAIPKFEVTTTLKNNAICKGNQMYIHFATSGYQYSIIKNGVLVNANVQNSVYDDVPATNDKYTVQALDVANNCKDSITIAPVILPLPSIGILIKNRKPAYCSTDTLHFEGTGTLVYALFKNDIFVNSFISRIDQPALSSGSFKTWGNDTNGCSAYSDTLQVLVNPSPDKPNISNSGNTLYTTAIGTLQWKKDGILLQDTSHIITNTSSGIYEVIVIGSNGCSNISDPFSFHYSTLFNTTLNSIKVYPNPAGDELNIDNDGLENFSLVLLNTNGQILLASTDNNAHTQLSVSHLLPGIYFLRITSVNGKTSVLKVNIFR